ncbi:MAG: ribosomal-processing cysteine protease Prp [Treponema sp.]|nr:ribosomal-processing cysteine protease Prp [Treponema sp.]
MITIRAALDSSGLLKSCRVQGHAGAGPKGGDIVCAAVSVLARTALAVLSNRGDVRVRGEAPERGVFSLEAEALNGAGRDFLAAAGGFLLAGLSSVARDYPENCDLVVVDHHGSERRK